MLVTMIIVASCQMKKTTVPFDSVTTKAEITKTLDSIDLALKSKDVKTFLSFYKDEGLYCGSDPNELWDKSSWGKALTQMLSDTTSSFKMNITKQEILLDNTGNSANVLRQFETGWSKPVQVRNTMHLTKTDNKWMVDFSSLALIPENKDLPKITGALSK